MLCDKELREREWVSDNFPHIQLTYLSCSKLHLENTCLCTPFTLPPPWLLFRYCHFSPLQSYFFPLSIWCGHKLQCPWHCGWDETSSHGLLSPVEEKGWHGLSLSERGHEGRREPLRKPDPWPHRLLLPFPGPLHRGWASFPTHRFTAGDYLLRTTKGRMLLITSKRRTLQL